MDMRANGMVLRRMIPRISPRCIRATLAFVDAFESDIAETARRARNKLVALIGRDRKPQGHRAFEKGPYLIQRLQLDIIHVDHHALHHDRYPLPVQTHTPLETRPRFRLIPHWKGLLID